MDHPANLMQVHLRRNNEELQDYLKGLDSWEEEMKEKDQGLVKKKSILKEVSVCYTIHTVFYMSSRHCPRTYLQCEVLAW